MNTTSKEFKIEHSRDQSELSNESSNKFVERLNFSTTPEQKYVERLNFSEREGGADDNTVQNLLDDKQR